MSRREEKRLVYISKSTLDRMLEAIRRKNTSINRMVEEALDLYLKLGELGYSSREALEILRAFKMLKPLGGIFIPKPVAEYMSNGCVSGDENLMRKWYEVGRAFGIYVKTLGQNPVELVEHLLKVLRWDLDDVVVECDGSSYRLRCASAALTEKETVSLAEFVKGILEGLQAHVDKLEVVRGIIVAEFKLQT